MRRPGFCRLLHTGECAGLLYDRFVALDVIPINNLISDLLSYLPSNIAAALIVFFRFIIGDFL